MSYPHDYTDRPSYPHLHNRGESRPYLEPDYHSNMHDAQLPGLSAMGRGPRGEGLYVGNVKDSDDEISFGLYSTLTGELVWQSPNLASTRLEFSSTSPDNLKPGVPASLEITSIRGNDVRSHVTLIPAGKPGSRIFLLGTPIERVSDDTYITTVGDLTGYGRPQYRNKPVPRPDDAVFFNYFSDDENGLAIGVIENVGGTTRETETGNVDPDTNAVFTARIYIPINVSTEPDIFG